MSASFNGMGMLTLPLVAVAVVALVIGIIALHRHSETGLTLTNPFLVHPLAAGGKPTVSMTPHASFGDPTIAAGSNDTSGLILGLLKADSFPNTANVTVTFSKPFPVNPSSVTLTPANESMARQLFWVAEITSEGFTLSMRKVNQDTTDRNFPQFYYLVM